MPLSLVNHDKPKPHRMLVYGVPGVGKTTFAACAPNPVFIPTEDGLVGKAEIDGKLIDLSKVPAFPKCQSKQQLLDFVGELCTEAHDHQTLVIDTADWLEQVIWRQVCEEGNKQAITDFDWGQGYGSSAAHLGEVLVALDWLRDNVGMHIIVLAHAKTDRFEDPEHSGYDRYVPKMHRDFAAKLIEWADEVLFCNHKTYTKETEVGYKKTKTKALGSGERVMRTSAKPTAIAKNRLGLPDEMPMSWDAFSEYLNA